MQKTTKIDSRFFSRSTFYNWHINLSHSCVNSSFCSCIQYAFSSIKLRSPTSNEPMYLRSSLLKHRMLPQARYTAISRKVVGKNVHTKIPKGNMGCWSIHCSWRTELLNLLLLLCFSTHKQTSKTSRAILSHFFEEQGIFATTFLEILYVYLAKSS